MKIAYYTLGCKVNAYDTEAIKNIMCQSGFTEASEKDIPDAVVINTCCVTNESERKCRQLIRRQKKINPDAIILVCGCYARTAKDDLQKLNFADIITQSKDPVEIVKLLSDKLNRNTLSFVDNKNINFEKNTFVTEFSHQTRATIKIQDGCNMFCSYCIIPYARGKLESLDSERVVAQINEIVAKGYKEVVLTGIHLASYNFNDVTLITLLEKISSETKIERLRLGSLEPRLLSEEFLLKLSKICCFCPHFHISMQSGSNTVLKRMNRKYTAEEYLETIQRVKKYFPSAMITTDVIVGFPAESEEEFAETIRVCEEIAFSHIHVFPFSPKKGTPASKMNGQLTNSVKHARSVKLNEKSLFIAKKIYYSLIGETFKVLFETRVADDVYEGYSENYIRVRTESKNDLCAKVVRVKAVGVYEDGIHGLEL